MGKKTSVPAGSGTSRTIEPTNCCPGPSGPEGRIRYRRGPLRATTATLPRGHRSLRPRSARDVGITKTGVHKHVAPLSIARHRPDSKRGDRHPRSAQPSCVSPPPQPPTTHPHPPAITAGVRAVGPLPVRQAPRARRVQPGQPVLPLRPEAAGAPGPRLLTSSLLATKSGVHQGGVRRAR